MPRRLRDQVIRSRTRLGNGMRGLLAENGIVLGQGIGVLRRWIPVLLRGRRKWVDGPIQTPVEGCLALWHRIRPGLNAPKTVYRPA